MKKDISVKNINISVNIEKDIAVERRIVNNINAYDSNNDLIWNISELLENYSNENNLEYYEELYFDVLILDENHIRCLGFYNHCDVDLMNKRIVKLLNNR